MSTENSQISGFQKFEPDDSIEYKKYLFGILANWHWFLVSLFAGLAIAFIINRYTLPVYKISSSLLISDESKAGGLTGYENLIPGMEIYRTQKLVVNEIEKLKSFELAKQTINKLNFGVSYTGVGRSGFKEAVLYNSCPFNVIPDSSKNNIYDYPVYIDILSKTQYNLLIDEQFNIHETLNFGEKFESPSFNFTIVLKDSAGFSPHSVYSKYYFKINSTNALIRNFRGRIGIGTNDARRGSVLFLSISGNNPGQISDYLNKLMEEYIVKGLKDKNQTAQRTVEFIDSQLASLDVSLQLAEGKLQNFRLANRLIDVKAEGEIASTKVEGLQNQKMMAEVQTRYYNYLKDYISDRNNLNQVVVPSIIGISDPMLSQLIVELNRLLSQKEELLFAVQPGNPKIVQTDSKIETLRSALDDNIKSLLMNNEINIAELNRQLGIAEQALNRFPVTEREYISIQRQYKVNDQIYTYLLQKRAESDIALAANVSDNQILDRARSENAYMITPQRKTNLILGFMIGILLPLGILIILDLMVNKVTSRADIERNTSVPIVSTIGHSSGSGDIPVFENPKSALSESFRGFRTNLQYLLPEKGQKVVSITSTISGEGKTFCSTNLASIFAMAGRKTLLIGLDLRKPKIHRIFNIDNSVGISTCLIGKTSLNDIVKPTEIENLYVAPAGPVPPNPAELLEGENIDRLFRDARNSFDMIVLDTPPFGVVTDARLIARHTDLNLFILRQNYSKINILDLLQEVYEKKEMGKMGIIMNDIKNKGYYGYGYRYLNYGYNYGYGYSYGYGTYYDKEEKSKS